MRRPTPRSVRLLILCVSSLLITASAGADSFRPGNAGVRLGLTLSNWRGESYSVDSVSTGKGLVFGVYRSFRLSEDFEIQSELLFSSRIIGLRHIYPVGVGYLAFDETVTLNYLELPLLARFPVTSIPDYRTALYLGPVFALSLGGKRSGEYTSFLRGIRSAPYSGRIANTSRFDFGVVVGFEFRLSDKPKSLIFDVRYVLGLRNAVSEVNDPTSLAKDDLPFADSATGHPDEVKNGALMISLGFGLF